MANRTLRPGSYHSLILCVVFINSSLVSSVDVFKFLRLTNAWLDEMITSDVKPVAFTVGNLIRGITELKRTGLFTTVFTFNIFFFLLFLFRMGNFTSSSPSGLSSTACAQYVQEVVSHHCVVIFSKTTCPYCKMAKNVFNEIGATYKVIELDEHNDGRRLQEALAQITGARTVPRVFINGNCIGGGSDTKQLHQQGKLVPLIEQCAPCCAGANPEGSGSGQFEAAK